MAAGSRAFLLAAPSVAGFVGDGAALWQVHEDFAVRDERAVVAESAESLLPLCFGAKDLKED